jgi:hypothetical protein
MYIKYGSSQTSPKSTVNAANNDYTVSYALQKNEVLVIELYANIGSTITSTDSFKTDLSVSGTGASSGAAASQLDKDGQTIAYVAGTFTTSVDSAAAKLAQSNSTVQAGTWRFRAENETFTISELAFKVASASTERLAVNSIVLKDAGVALGSPAFLQADSDGTYVGIWTGLNISVAANTEKALTVDVNTADVNTVVATGKNVALTLDYTKYKNSSGNESTDGSATSNSGDEAGAAVYVHDSVPSLASSTVSGTLSTGAQERAKFTLTPNGGAVGLNTIQFAFTKSSGVKIASSSAADFQLLLNGANLSVASVSHTNLGGDGTSGILEFEFASEQVISSAATFSLVANVTTTGGADKDLTFSLSQDSTKVSPAAAQGATLAGASLIWSDRSASSHSFTTADWMNSALVQTLPMSWGQSN